MAQSEFITSDAPDPSRHVRTVWLVSTLLLFCLIGFLTLMPVSHMAHNSGYWDKVAHLVAFLALVLPTAALWPRAALWVGVLAVVYGAAIEVIQPFVGRGAEIADLLADGLGVGLGLVLGASLRRWIRSRRRALTG